MRKYDMTYRRRLDHLPCFCGQLKGLVIGPILREKEGGRREEIRGGVCGA